MIRKDGPPCTYRQFRYLDSLGWGERLTSAEWGRRVEPEHMWDLAAERAYKAGRELERKGYVQAEFHGGEPMRWVKLG